MSWHFIYLRMHSSPFNTGRIILSVPDIKRLCQRKEQTTPKATRMEMACLAGFWSAKTSCTSHWSHFKSKAWETQKVVQLAGSRPVHVPGNTVSQFKFSYYLLMMWLPLLASSLWTYICLHSWVHVNFSSSVVRIQFIWLGSCWR